MDNELLFDVTISLLKQLKAHQMFLDWVKDKAGSDAQNIENVLLSAQTELASVPALESKLRGVVEAVLLAGGKNLDSALAAALRAWNPTGRPN